LALQNSSAEMVFPFLEWAGNAQHCVAALGVSISRPAVPHQTVKVFANGQKIADWEVADTADFSARIPAVVTRKGGILNIGLRVPNTTSSKALGLGDDSRILGVRVYSIELNRP
jgi:hypothetical protein